MKIESGGRECDFDEIRAHVCSRIFDWPLEFLGRGTVAREFLHNNWVKLVLGELFDPIVESAEKQSLTPEEAAWLKNLARLREKLESFDRQKYESLKGECREAFVVSFGLACARILEEMQVGYKVPEHLCSFWDHPLDCYISQTRQVCITDPGGWISYPMGLKWSD